MTPFLHRVDVESVAGKYGLPADLVHAQCLIESGGDTWAWNPEPRYRWLWDVKHKRPFRTLTAAEQLSEAPPSDFPCLAGDRDQEFWGQQASFGLLQVMGAVAREFGFQERYLTQLCQPRYGLEFGCSVLRARLKWAKDDVAKALAAFNAGPGGVDLAVAQAYVRKVLATRETVRLERET